MIDSKNKCVCFTGHRPEKLSLSEDEVKSGLRQEISKAISEGYTTFITGMAKGVDLWAGEIVLNLRGNSNDIKLVAADPYAGFGKGWSSEWKSLHDKIIAEADHVENVCSSYNKGCFMIRNKWMVDHSNLVIAVFNGEAGGTKNTIDYAQKQKVEVRFLGKSNAAKEQQVSPAESVEPAKPQDNVIGLHVVHAKYGSGVITSQSAATVTVQFSEKELKFEYPKAFTNKFLKRIDDR